MPLFDTAHEVPQGVDVGSIDFLELVQANDLFYNGFNQRILPGLWLRRLGKTAAGTLPAHPRIRPPGRIERRRLIGAQRVVKQLGQLSVRTLRQNTEFGKECVQVRVAE